MAVYNIFFLCSKNTILHAVDYYDFGSEIITFLCQYTNQYSGSIHHQIYGTGQVENIIIIIFVNIDIIIISVIVIIIIVIMIFVINQSSINNGQNRFSSNIFPFRKPKKKLISTLIFGCLCLIKKVLSFNMC